MIRCVVVLIFCIISTALSLSGTEVKKDGDVILADLAVIGWVV